MIQLPWAAQPIGVALKILVGSRSKLSIWTILLFDNENYYSTTPHIWEVSYICIAQFKLASISLQVCLYVHCLAAWWDELITYRYLRLLTAMTIATTQHETIAHVLWRYKQLLTYHS